MQLLAHLFDVDVLLILNIDCVLLDAVLECFDVFNVVVFLHLLLVDYKLATHDVDVLLVNFDDDFADADDSKLDVHPVFGTIFRSQRVDVESHLQVDVHNVHLVYLVD